MKRLDYIDNARGFGMLMVILGHIMTKPNLFKNWFYSFHIPLFFIVSGFLIYIKHQNKKKIDMNIKKKIKDLMIPYFIFSFFNTFLLGVYSFFNNKSYSFIFVEFKKNIKSTFLFYGVKATWFLPCMFFALTIFYFLYKNIKNKKIASLSIILLYIVPFLNISFVGGITEKILFRAFIAVGFIFLGYAGAKYVEKIPNSWPIIICINLLNILYFNFSKTNFDLCYLKLGDPFLYTVCGVLGTLGVILFFRKISSKKINCSILNCVGKNSLVIMGTHMLVIYFLKLLFVKFIGQSFINNLYYYVPVMLICVILIEYIVVIIYNKIFPLFMNRLEKVWCKNAKHI